MLDLYSSVVVISFFGCEREVICGFETSDEEFLVACVEQVSIGTEGGDVLF